MGQKEKKYAPVPPARWPDAAPKHDDEHVASIICGNTHLHWAFHEGKSSGFAPTLYWRTPHLGEEEMKAGSLMALSKYIPDSVHEYIFGKGNEPTKEAAENASRDRLSPKFSVYMVASNQDQAERVAHLWSEVPSQVWMLDGDNFFTKEQGRYDTMGADRLAALYAASELVGPPTLVFDGGTAMTYTALDTNGNIMGGGISVGVGKRFFAVSEYASALPYIGDEELGKIVEQAETGKPIDLFARNTKEAITASNLNEIACSGRNVIKQWIERVGSAESSPTVADADKSGGAKMEEMKTGGVKITTGEEDEELVNRQRVVYVTGGDSDVISKLLQPDRSGVLEAEPGSTNPEPPQYEVRQMKKLTQYGISALLSKQTELRQRDPEYQAWEMAIVGTRVAKLFSMEDADGDAIFRGTIRFVTSGQKRSGDLFKVFYDDGDSEEMEAAEICEALRLYCERGEKAKEGADKEEEVAKKEKSKAAAELITKECELSTGEEQAAASAAAENGNKENADGTVEQTQQVPAEPAAEISGSQKRSYTSSPKTSSEKPAKKKKKGLEHEPTWYMNKRVAKRFGTELYYGTVDDYQSGDSDDNEGALWHVTYDDEDKEDFEEKDLRKGLRLYEKHKAGDLKGQA